MPQNQASKAAQLKEKAAFRGSATPDFRGTKKARINYGMLFTAWSVAGIIGPRIGGLAGVYPKERN